MSKRKQDHQESQELGFRVGKWLRRYRQRSGMTQREVAEAAGVTAQCISQLENDRRSASGTLLKRILAALDVHSLGEFFYAMERQEDPVCRSTERQEMTGPEERVSVQYIGPRNNSFDFFLMYVEMLPGYEYGEAEPESHPQDECLYTLTGKIGIYMDGEEHIAGPGDACFIPANCLHKARNLSKGTSAYIQVSQSIPPREALEKMRQFGAEK